ncbi:Zn-dependent protease with chaperone function [Halapricum desulfuricans]|uniref:Zn-dependent protease with chaperone function n=1 Tax=Halapricum desulfuricans TaxID=2841257 RepID=A0A897NNB4_9EURY|nr:Zn-dependent protease with chaperone function [Halapricum desulfuricans]
MVFVTALLGLLAPFVERARGAVAPAVPGVVWWTVLVGLSLSGLLAVQLRTARAMALSRADVTRLSASDAPELHDRVERLSALLDRQPPAVGLIDSTTPNCFSVGGGDPMIVLSSGLREQLTDAELDAVLAHELAHLQNRDATVMTLATFLPALASDRPVAGLPRWLRANLFGGAVLFALIVAAGWTDPTSPVSLLVAAGLSLVLGGVGLGVLATPVVYLTHRLSRDREFAADRAGAMLTGEPEALASALRKLDDAVESSPETDLRSMDSLVEGLCLLPYGFSRDESADDDGLTIKLRSHPPTDRRIERLQSVAAELEGGEDESLTRPELS